MLPSPFQPTPTQQLEILDALTDPTRSLRDIAQAHNTSTPALSAWLARPEIDAQLAALDTLTTRRVRLAAATSLTPVIAIANQVLAAFIAEETALTPDPKTLAKRADHKTDCRARSSALRAAAVIVRLAKFSLPQHDAPATPRPRVPRHESAPAPTQPDLQTLRTRLAQAAHELPPRGSATAPAATAAKRVTRQLQPAAASPAPSTSMPVEIPSTLDHLTALNTPTDVTATAAMTSQICVPRGPIAPAIRPGRRRRGAINPACACNLAVLAGKASGP